jgi:hypothetical protein
MALGAWDRTAMLAALLAEPSRDRESRSSPYSPNDFHPFRAVGENVARTDAIPYSPEILQQIHNSRAR